VKKFFGLSDLTISILLLSLRRLLKRPERSLQEALYNSKKSLSGTLDRDCLDLRVIQISTYLIDVRKEGFILAC
jgi:hypothetical protein